MTDKYEEGFVSDDSEDEELETKDTTFNDKEVMESMLKDMKCQLDWIQHLDVTVDLSELSIPGEDGNAKTDKQIKQTNDIQDDFHREMMFYCQAQVAAKEGLKKLRDLNVPTERPEDYFAEMIKSDIHMQKIRQKLLDRKQNMENSEKAKKQRQLKKIGKKVQQEVLRKRQEDKKKMLHTVDQIKKGKNKLARLENDEDIFNVSAGSKNKDQNKSNMKRKRKDDKFGFGGKKRKMKKNSAESSSEVSSSFKPRIHGKSNQAQSQKYGNKNQNTNKARHKRLGKSRRLKGGKK